MNLALKILDLITGALLVIFALLASMQGVTDDPIVLFLVIIMTIGGVRLVMRAVK